MAAAAGIGAGVSLLSGILGSKSAKAAAKTQAAAYQKGIDEQHRQFDVTTGLIKPSVDFGQSALGPLGDILGLNGPDAQGLAISGLKQSPAFTSRYNTGADTILQNSSATGGLRGGNTQNSLANFGSQLLDSVINGQTGNLFSAANLGTGAATSLGGLGQQNAQSIAQLLGQQGNANASGILGANNALTNGFTNAAKSAGSFGGSSGFGGGAGDFASSIAQYFNNNRF